MSEEETTEINEMVIKCPACNVDGIAKSIMKEIEIPHFGKVLETTIQCKKCGFKTEYDTTRRLSGQLVDYTRVFQQCYVVIPKHMQETYEREIPPYIGIILLIDNNGCLTLKEARPAVENKNIDAGMMMKCLRTKEYENIVIEEFGKLPDVPYYEMYKACEEKLFDIPPDKLHRYFLNEIEKRKNNMCLLKKAPRELRQMYLQLGLSKGQIDILQTYLNNPIKSQLKLCISHI